ncbi:MAG: hypothetical protein KDA79_01545 [Planctomycetaceae bacterium]|nr:hypothetical protein [Planctomycetaceae bacterium]
MPVLPAAEADSPAAGSVTISTEFPGGNAATGQNEAGLVQIAPDLRGDNPWFYWYFAATAKQAGRVVFETPAKVAGFKNGGIGFQGPAISTDGGSTWQWMGTENVKDNTFFYDFARAGDVVRFAVTIPYVQSDLKAFLKQHADNPHLKQSELTTSRNGRSVDLLQIGTPGPNVQPVLVTARHHAAETIASYVLEGFLQEAMSDEPAGVAFREKYVLFAVPLVDTDGVAEGDQGKNRKPWDHNRDYKEGSIYPEVQAIMALGEAQNFRFALDFHCPTLVFPDHQVMYFVGAKTHPQHNFQNVTLFAERIKAGLPKTAPHGPLVWLRAEKDASPKSSRFFGFRDDTTLSATLEIPFAPPGRKTDPASCRLYGQIMLKAFVETEFLTGKE